MSFINALSQFALSESNMVALRSAHSSTAGGSVYIAQLRLIAYWSMASPRGSIVRNLA